MKLKLRSLWNEGGAFLFFGGKLWSKFDVGIKGFEYIAI